MWKGRFTQDPDELMLEYSCSVDVDKVFAHFDIQGSMAHAKMLAHVGVLKDEEAKKIVEGLSKIEKEIEEGTFPWREELEDVHLNIEQRLTELIGDVGKKLHTGRSRNDQVALDFRLFVSHRLYVWRSLLIKLIESLVDRAREHRGTLLPGYTHLQPAQPVSLAQHLLAYVQMFKRDVERIEDVQKRIRISPLGAAALAGTTYPLDPFFVARELGMEGVFENSMDAVSDRDFVLEGLFIGSTIMMHLSRLCEEIILWANPCFGFVTLPDEFSTGSSIMPQKKNPDAAELMRGKTGRSFGNLLALFTLLKGLPLAYNRDMQEDKPPFLNTDRDVSLSLEVMHSMIDSLIFNEDRMSLAMKQGFLNATELADYLVLKGIPFREAHYITGKLVKYAEENGKSLEDLSLEEFKSIEPSIEEDVYDVLDLKKAVERRLSHGGTGFSSISKQLLEVEKWLNSRRENKNGGSV